MRLLILGADEAGRALAERVRTTGRYEEIVFLDNNLKGEDILAKCGAFSVFADGMTEMVPGFGDPALRREWLEQLEGLCMPVAYDLLPEDERP